MKYKRTVQLPASAAAVFDWHERPGAFERLAPPWQSIRVVDRRGGIRGGRVVLELSKGPFSLRWVLEHRDFIEGVQFRDVQIKGPFRSWDHKHEILATGANRCRLEDEIEFELPFGRLGDMIAGAIIEKELDRLFEYRHRQTADDIASHIRAAQKISLKPDEMEVVAHDNTGTEQQDAEKGRPARPEGAKPPACPPKPRRRRERTSVREEAERLRRPLAAFSSILLSTGGRRMKLLVTGASGLIGTALVPFLTTGGHEIVRAVRSSDDGKNISWDPDAGVLKPEETEGFDGVIHLAGESIAAGRWNEERKRRIKQSRVKGTQLLAHTLAGLEKPPRVLVSASAIGIYGDRAEEELTEESAAGSGFLAEVCREWEAATEEAKQRGIRVVHARFGVVLSPKGGALAKMLFPFKMGAGGVIGGGEQYMSWITLDDVVGAIGHMLVTDSIAGPVNVVAPAPVTNREFTKTLGRVLKRPTIAPLPAFAARLVLGEMADPLLLWSARVKPVALIGSGYTFRHESLEVGLRHMLGKA